MATIDPHFLLALKASGSALAIAKLLPETDLIDELEHMLETQWTLMLHLVQGKHYGTDRMNDFEYYLDGMQKEITRIAGGNEFHG